MAGRGYRTTDAKALLLLGSFLLFAVTDGISAFRRPRSDEQAARLRNDVLVIIVAAATYWVIVVWLHAVLFGVPAW